MNRISTLQAVAAVDSERLFRQVLENAMDSTTDQLLLWNRFEPEQFGIETPRHAPILAKKIILPVYALLSHESQEATVEKICKQIEEDVGVFCAYELDAEQEVIAVYFSSAEVDTTTLIDLFEEKESFANPDMEEDEDEEDQPDYLDNPEILVGCDVTVNGLLRTVLEVDAEQMTARLDDDTELDIEEIEIDDLDGSYFIPEAENFGVDRTASGYGPVPEDEDELDEDDEFAEESPEVIVPQIRESETDDEDDADDSENETASHDDDFPEEELQPVAENETPAETVETPAEENDDEALAAAIAEEQTEAEAIDWKRPPVEPVPPVAAPSAPEASDDDFAEEEQPESPNVAQNEAQAPVAPAAETAEAAPADGISDSEQARRIELLEGIKAELPDDSLSEIKDGALVVLIVKNDTDYELTINVTQQMFAGARMIDIFVLSSKDGSVGRRASNAAAIIDAINSL
jgi:hypothetical protein